jgi:pseudouridine synthase
MEQGRVRVNGTVVTVLGARVDPKRDVVEVDGTRVELQSPRWILLHKPAGTLTTMSDPGGRPTVYSLLPRELRTLRYVGRLDLETEGLLLFTNQGDAANRLTHPSGGYEREYYAGVKGSVDARSIAKLVQGVELEDGLAQASQVRLLRKEPLGDILSLVLLEGRKREVRRLLEAVGHGVRWLRRMRFGPLELGALQAGEWRELTPTEVKTLLGSPTGVKRERAHSGRASRGGSAKAHDKRSRPRKPGAEAGKPERRGKPGPSGEKPQRREKPGPSGEKPQRREKPGPSAGKPARKGKGPAAKPDRASRIRRGPGARARHPGDDR